MDSGHRLYLHLPEMYLCAIHIVCTWSALQGHKMRRLKARLSSDGHRELHCSRAALTSTASAQRQKDNNNHDDEC